MKIFLLDKETLFRDGVKSLLTAAGHSVNCFLDDFALIDQVRSFSPEVIFMEPMIFSGDPNAVLISLKESMPGVKVVFITADEKHARIVDAIQAGADGYLSKHIDSVDFFEMLERLKRDEPAITPAIADLLFKVLRKRPGGGHALLTEIERKVITHAAEGYSNAAIAVSMGISENTVKFHLKKVNQKLHTTNRTEAVMVALQNGLIIKSGTNNYP